MGGQQECPGSGGEGGALESREEAQGQASQEAGESPEGGEETEGILNGQGRSLGYKDESGMGGHGGFLHLVLLCHCGRS